MARNNITESEYEIMKVLWSAEKSLSLGEIMARIDVDWTRNTVGTLLVRLSEKGAVKSEKCGKSNLYYPLLEEKDYSSTETKSFLTKLYNGSVGNLVASLFENKEYHSNICCKYILDIILLRRVIKLSYRISFFIVECLLICFFTPITRTCFSSFTYYS